MSQKVTRDQFEVKQDAVLHTPTGATFFARPDDGRVMDIDAGLAGDKASRKDFDIQDLERVARQLLAERLQARE